MLKIIAQNYQWSCGDGCCYESKHKLHFFIKDSEDNRYVKFYCEDLYGDGIELYQEVVNYYNQKDDEFITALIEQASMQGQLIFETTDDEFVN